MESISISCLGDYGRFGNQLFQYSFAKTYALKCGYELQVPKNWIGRILFDIEDPEITRGFPTTSLDEMPVGQHSIDLRGSYQHQMFIDTMNPNTVRSFFKFKDQWIELFPKIKSYYIASHLRRGDYVGNPTHTIVEEAAYENAIKNFGYNLDDNIFVGEEIVQPGDTRNHSHDKSFYGNVDFLYDFFLLLNADVLFRSNSTLGWWAAFLSKESQKVYSPVVQGRLGEVATDIAFVEGNHPCHQEIDNRHSDLSL